MRLARRQMESRGIAQGIATGVDFRGQSAFAAADRFVRIPFLSRLAPAEC